MADDRNKKKLEIELCREFKRIGLPHRDAARLARHRSKAIGTAGHGIYQHVVPVSRGWVVLSDLPSLDDGLFPTKKAALEEAQRLAEAAGLTVIVHDGRNSGED